MEGSLILLPTYNERENLPLVVPRLGRIESVDVLVIDDSSPDGTGELAEELRSGFPRLSVLHRKRKEGLGRAYVEGFKEALSRGYRRVITMDADLSHAPEDVPRLLDALEESDVAIGSRQAAGGGVENWPVSRRLLSRAGSFYARALLGLSASDVTSGFRAYRLETLEEVDLDSVESAGFVFQVEILRRILALPGKRAVEVPIVFRNRSRGCSKLSSEVIREAAFQVMKLALRRGRAPERGRKLREGAAVHPRVSVVVPTRPEAAQPEALGALGELIYPRDRLEVFVVRGSSPSRQRNEAVRRSRGEYLFFLDDDSLVSPDTLSRLLGALERNPGAAAAGGPAEVESGGSGRLRAIPSLVLSEPWVMGRSASRYRARGELRETDERELILCNLCVRRSALVKAGGFDERLYPNEENALLERLKRDGWKLLYSPRAVVRRHSWRSVREFLRAIYGYGRGRGAQARCVGSGVTARRLGVVSVALLGFLASLWGAIGGQIVAVLPLALYGLYLLFLWARLSLRGGVGQGLWGAALSVLLHGSYAGGVAAGLLRKPRSRDPGELTVERLGLGKEEVPIWNSREVDRFEGRTCAVESALSGHRRRTTGAGT